MRKLFTLMLFCSMLAAPAVARAGAKAEKAPGSAANPYAVPAYDDDDLRAALVVMLDHDGVTLDWDRFSVSRLTECWLRQSLARSIRSKGFEVDWTRYHLWQIAFLSNAANKGVLNKPVNGSDLRTFILTPVAEQYCRSEIVGELRGLGVNVTGRGHSAGDLIDWFLRAYKARELGQHGVTVDWHQHSFAELLHWSLKLQTAETLKKHSVCWQWRDHTLMEMMDALGQAKRREQQPASPVASTAPPV